MAKNDVKAGGAYVEITADNSKLYKGLKDAEDKLKNFSGNVEDLGAAFAGLGATLAAPAALGVKAFADFEQRILTLKGVTRATESELQKMNDVALELGASTSWSASQVADGMTALGRMGFNPSEIVNAISPTMDLARGLGVTVDEAADMLGAALNQFGAGAVEAVKYADILTKATNSAAISATELGESLKYSGAAGAAVGQTAEDVVALTMSLRNMGLDASQAGTSLRSIFLSLQNAGKASQFEELFNVNLRGADGQLRSLVDVFAEAQAAAQGMGDKLAGTVQELFGTVATTAGVSLLSAPDLSENKETMKSSAGAAKELREEMESGLTGSFDALKSAVEGASIALGDALAPEIKGLAETITKIASALIGFIEDNKDLVKTLGRNAAGLLAVGAAFTALGVAARTTSNVTGVAKSAFASLADTFLKLKATATGAGVGIQKTGASLDGAAVKARGANKAFTALKMTLAGLSKAFKIFSLTTFALAGWNALLEIFSQIANYATKTADEMERARAAREKKMEDITTAKESAQQAIEQRESAIDDVLNRATRSNLSDRERATLQEDIDRMTREGIFADGDIVATDEGFQVRDAAVEFEAKQRARDLSLFEGREKVATPNLDLSAYNLSSKEKVIDATQIDLKPYEMIADTLNKMSDAGRRAFKEEYTHSLFGIELGETGSQWATSLNYTVSDMWRGFTHEDKMLAMGMLADPQTAAALREIMDANQPAFGFSGTDPTSSLESFIADVKAVRQSISDFDEFANSATNDYSKDIEENRLKPFTSQEQKQALEEFQATATAASLAALEAAKGVQNEEVKETKTEDEIKLEELQKQRETVAKTIDELGAKGDLSALDADRFFEALDILDTAIYAQFEKVRAAREQEQSEQAKTNLETTIEDLGDPLTMSGEELKKTITTLSGAFKNAEGLGVDTSIFKAQLLDALSVAASQLTPTTESAATLNAFEALDMARRDDSDLLRQQRDYLKDMLNRLNSILNAVENKNEEGGDLI